MKHIRYCPICKVDCGPAGRLCRGDTHHIIIDIEDIRGESIICRDSYGYFVGNKGGKTGEVLPSRFGAGEPEFINYL